MDELLDTASDSRTIFIFDDIDANSAHDVIKKIYEYNRIDDEYESLIHGYTRDPIEIIISTEGGSAYDCLNIYDAITSSKTPINTIALKAFSAGFIIFLGGDERLAYENSSLMLHQVQVGGSWGPLTFVQKSIKELERISNIINKIIVEETNITLEEIKQNTNLQEDWYMSTEEALELGVIDGIIVSKEARNCQTKTS